MRGAGWTKVDKLPVLIKFLGGKGEKIRSLLSFSFFFFDSSVCHVGFPFPDQGPNPCPSSESAKSYPLDPQGSPQEVYSLTQHGLIGGSQFTITIDLSVVLRVALDTPLPLANPYFFDYKMRILAYLSVFNPSSH